MKKKFFAGLAAGLLVGSMASVSGAAITTYTDQTLWESAVGTTTAYDFESATLGPFTYTDFGDFDATLYSNVVHLYDPKITSHAGSQVLQLQMADHISRLTFEIEMDVLALGFDWFNSDIYGADTMEISINGFNHVFGSSQASGFFGITSDVVFNSFSLSDTAGGNGYLMYGGIDNLSYKASAPVPEPTVMLLFGTGLAGLIGSRMRKKKK